MTSRETEESLGGGLVHVADLSQLICGGTVVLLRHRLDYTVAVGPDVLQAHRVHCLQSLLEAW